MKKIPFNMLELMCALVIGALMTAMFFSLLGDLRRRNAAIEAESAAILVLGNTVERLRGLETPCRTEAERIFREEFAAAKPGEALTASVLKGEKGLQLGVRRGEAGPFVAEVVLSCRD